MRNLLSYGGSNPEIPAVKRIPITAVLLFVFSILSPFFLHGQEVTKVGTTAAKFLSIPVGSRALAMGGSFVSVADDATAMYWNPGGIARLYRREIILIHSEWLADINFDYAGIVLPSGGLGTFGLNFTSMNMGEMQITTEDEPEGTGESFSAGSFAFGFSFARNLTDRFSIGANVKYIEEHIWNSKSSGIAIDVGTLFTMPLKNIRFGASISNFGQKLGIKGDDLLVQKDIDATIAGNNESVNAYLATDKFDLPLLLRIGFSMDIMNTDESRLTVSVDGLHPNDNTESINLGGEFSMFRNIISIRAGYKSLFLKDGDEEFTVGGGLNYELMRGFILKVDYAYENFVHLNDIHKFSLGLMF
ncbi:MAG: PorV/PorQ family protein [Fidelibacterota bacterium]